MGINHAPLTTREKAAIYWHVATGRKQWKETYLAAQDKPVAEAEKSPHLDTYVSRFKQRPAVKEYAENLQYKFRKDQEDHDAEIIRRYEEEKRRQEEKEGRNGRNGQGAQAGPVDYTDPKQQRRKLNELVNSATDQRETLDALKTIISMQKDDRDAAREQKTVRAYLPMTCTGCPLYQKAKRKL